MKTNYRSRPNSTTDGADDIPCEARLSTLYARFDEKPAHFVPDAGFGMAGTASAGGGAGFAEPRPNCQVHDAEPREPAGCMNPMLPVTAGVLEPLTVVFDAGAWLYAGQRPCLQRRFDAICKG